MQWFIGPTLLVVVVVTLGWTAGVAAVRGDSTRKRVSPVSKRNSRSVRTNVAGHSQSELKVIYRTPKDDTQQPSEALKKTFATFATLCSLDVVHQFLRQFDLTFDTDAKMCVKFWHLSLKTEKELPRPLIINKALKNVAEYARRHNLGGGDLVSRPSWKEKVTNGDITLGELTGRELLHSNKYKYAPMLKYVIYVGFGIAGSALMMSKNMDEVYEDYKELYKYYFNVTVSNSSPHYADLRALRDFVCNVLTPRLKAQGYLQTEEDHTGSQTSDENLPALSPNNMVLPTGEWFNIMLTEDYFGVLMPKHDGEAKTRRAPMCLVPRCVMSSRRK